MAHVYVDSAAAGGGNGSTWALAYQTLAAALTAKAAGDDFWVAHTHAETTAGAVALVSPGTSALPCRVICVNKAGTVPPVAADLATTATIGTTTTNSHITMSGIAYCYGIEFKPCTDNLLGSVRWTGGAWKMKNCKFTVGTTSTSIVSPANSALTRTEWEDCTVRFGALGQSVSALSWFLWTATTGSVSAIDAAGVIPTTLFSSSSSGVIRLRGLDFSQIVSGKNLFGAMTQPMAAITENCRFGGATAGVKVTAPTNAVCQDIILSRVERTGLNYTFDKVGYSGTESTEATIVSTGGASDGTTPISKKVITTAFSRPELAFECIPIVVWNDTVATARTVTVQAYWDSGAVPTNANIWIEVEYLSNASYPISSTVSTGLVTVLSTPASYAAGTNTWGDTTSPFAMVSPSFTPQMKGPITVRVKCALASTTFYIDPKVVIT